MPPKAKTGKRVSARSTPASDTAIQTTETKSDRPGRTRKPTQKAAELAADRSSKLFKSGEERQLSKDIDEDDTSSRTEASPLTSAGKTDHAVWASVSPRKTASTSVKQQHVAKSVNSSPTTKSGRKTGVGRTAASSASQTTPITSKKRKHTAESEDPEEAPSKKIKPSTHATRSKSKTPAPTTTKPVPKSTPTIKCTKSPRKRKQTEEPEALEKAPSEKTKTIDTRLTRSKNKTPATETAQTVPTPAPAIVPIKSTKKRKRSTTTINTEPPLSNPPPALKPTRLKFKPIQPSIDSAREGATGLPCALSCLNDDQLFYMWAAITIENEELADEVLAWTGFDGDTSSKACLLRRRWNAVLAGSCVCGRSKGVSSGRKGGKGK